MNNWNSLSFSPSRELIQCLDFLKVTPESLNAAEELVKKTLDEEHKKEIALRWEELTINQLSPIEQEEERRKFLELKKEQQSNREKGRLGILLITKLKEARRQFKLIQSHQLDALLLDDYETEQKLTFNLNQQKTIIINAERALRKLCIDPDLWEASEDYIESIADRNLRRQKELAMMSDILKLPMLNNSTQGI